MLNRRFETGADHVWLDGRRIAVGGDGRTIWYVDYSRGFLGKLEPATLEAGPVAWTPNLRLAISGQSRIDQGLLRRYLLVRGVVPKRRKLGPRGRH